MDALVVVCPSCFQQFDLNQAALKRAGEDLHVPVLYLAELMALAGGHAPDEIGLGMHRVDVQPFLDAWNARLDYRERLARPSTCRCSTSATAVAPAPTTAPCARSTPRSPRTS